MTERSKGASLCHFGVACAGVIWHKPRMRLFVGLTAHKGSIRRYPFELLELPVSDSLPKPKTLRAMKEGRPDVTLTLRLHPDVVMHGPEHHDVERAKVAASCVQAPVVVIPSSPRFTPTATNFELLSGLAAKLRDGERRVAWEPRGVFSPREAENWAERAGVLLVRDGARETLVPGPVAYCRLLPLGSGARISQHASEVLAEQLQEFETAYVLVGGDGAKGLRSRLRDWLGLTGEDEPLDSAEPGDDEDLE